MPIRPARALLELRRIHRENGDGLGRAKIAALRQAARARYANAAALGEYHEILCYLRAFPDDAAVLDLVETGLATFARRADLKRLAAKLENSGIAGCDIRYPFFYPTAVRLAARHAERLHLDFDHLERPSRFEELLALFALWAETPGLDEGSFDFRGWLELLRGRSTDAAFLIESTSALPASQPLREKLWDVAPPMIVLRAAADTPSRTAAKWSAAPISYRTGATRRGRPDLAEAVHCRPLSVTDVTRSTAIELIDMARDAMVTRSRDLDAFAYGDPEDVRLVDFGDGLSFAVIGMIPERRLLLESVYGQLTLMNGVPIGYVLTSALFGSSEIAYNVFETFRGGEAAFVYGRVLAMTRHLFGSDTFTIYPYQLGQANDEALASGAWWFYRKLGFRPRDAGALRVMEREETRMRRDPAHRSSRATLAKLADGNMYWETGKPRRDVIGELPGVNVGLAVSRFVAGRFGADRRQAERVLEDEARSILDIDAIDSWTAGERQALTRWSPLMARLEGVAEWSAAAKAAAVAVIRLKGGRRESAFVEAFDAHEDLRQAVVDLAWGRKRRRRAARSE